MAKHKFRGAKAKGFLHSLIANIRKIRPSTKSFPVSAQYQRRRFLRVWWNRLSTPWVICSRHWVTLPSVSWAYLKALKVNFDPWSLWITLGNPKVVQNLSSSFTTTLAFNVCSGTASGRGVAAHMMVKKYLCPNLALGNSPKRSTIKHSNGLPRAGIGQRGAAGIFWLGLPANWHVWHDLQNQKK